VLRQPYPSARQRIDLMQRVPGMLRKYRQKILQALDADFCGHSHDQGDLLEILGMFDRAKFNIDHVAKWMRPVAKASNPITQGASRAYIKYQPKGVVGNMVSWNFPFDIAVGPMLDQLGAGNRVIIKPSDLSPACGQVLHEMCKETFDEDQVAIVNGGLETARYFPTLAWDHLKSGLPRVPLPHPQRAGRRRALRREELCARQTHDRRLRPDRLAGKVRRYRRHEPHRQPRRRRP
jgi:coniferyl-aldehyde dehydrogenase